MIEGTRTLVRANGDREQVKTLIPETPADVEKLKKMGAVFEPTRIPPPAPPDFDRAKLDAARKDKAKG